MEITRSLIRMMEEKIPYMSCGNIAERNRERNGREVIPLTVIVDHPVQPQLFFADPETAGDGIHSFRQLLSIAGKGKNEKDQHQRNQSAPDHNRIISLIYTDIP